MSISSLDSMLPVDPSREWRDVPGFEGIYMVSNDGRVASLERKCRTGRGERTVRTRLLKRTEQFKDGELMSVRVKLSADTGPFHATVARLILMAFEGEREGVVAHYRDGDPKNIHLDNLEWTTYSAIAMNPPNGGYGFDANRQGLQKHREPRP